MTSVRAYRHGSSQRGFTLIELLAAMIIGSMILLAAVTILGRTGDSYDQIGGNVSAQREARAALTQLSRDLSSSVYHEEEVFSKTGASWSTDRIGFLSLQPSEAQSTEKDIGDLCAINYYVADITSGGKTVRCLKRGFRNSLDTINAIKNSSIASLFQPDSQLDEEIAFGVVSFQARPKIRNPETSQLVDWDKSKSDSPEYIELQLVIARPDLAGKLKNADDWSNSRLLGAPVNVDNTKGLEVYQTLVHFGNDTSTE
ncbi:prepilin-type N-terminal cleavage/methylation domain-containing protein [Luteolibacter pohnpeiensis]|uniref:Prepilin-type N-terminal cleavage/methylation domain-containing protein n=1 Tax=Luteolibacter pohnpeiensis TaxID=454153 RepID=A0A934S806_9BACT|nr:prepilin-type N-terminal cleavage/methylation domain-containing protein [Luteolibacter pohnpeiensis]MBK1881382.1 prepilin-type N-terminal cleavage/methylation domain-containing protein [Luteolibacter pohnpeiensis]